MRKNDKEHSAPYKISTVIYTATAMLVIFINVMIAVSSGDAAGAVAAACIATAVGFLLIVGTAAAVNKRAERYRELENLANAIRRIKSMAVIWDTSFGYIRVNEAFTNITGYTEEDMKNPEVLKKIFPSNVFSSNISGITDKRDEEFFITAKSGAKVCTVWNTSVVTAIPGRVLFPDDITKVNSSFDLLVTIGPDITEIIRMKQEIYSYSRKLAESEKRYELSTNLSDIGLILKEKGSSRFYVSERLCEMLCISSIDGYIEGETLREAIHPKDRVVLDTFSAGAKDESETGKTHSADLRVMSADGKYHWYNFRYRFPKNGDVSAGGALMDITREKEKDLVIERMAYIDDVTQIYNRNKFMMTGSEILECAKSDPNINYWVIVFDIDSFHIINDTCGYTNGNKLLKEIAAILMSNISEGGFAARIGGDNFAMILRSTGDDESPKRLIKRIQREISDISCTGLENQNVTCSAGYCLLSDSRKGDFAQVLDRAEFALSLSDGSRSNILRYDNRAHDAIIAGTAIEKELSKAVENHELTLYYQPKINLEDGSVMGMEALIRWIKPDGTIVPPGDFIPVAEKSLLITKISKFVLYEACRQNKAWQDMGLPAVTVSVNLTAIDFYQTNVTETIEEVLRETGLDPVYLDVELTESLALKDIDHAVSQMTEIKNLGVKLSMDDFGTGYSSLSYIQILPITLLKLDRSFIMYLEEDEISREIVSAVIRIAKSKKIETIAEGIETVGQGEILKQSGCDYAQGYFFGKPMPAEKFEEFLRERATAPEKA